MINVDTIIFGGGIAGLWTLARLTKQGFNAILLETNALGCGQTIKSQGIIHGGLKYALSGNISSSVTSLQDMPVVWQQCIDGVGEVNLSGTKILAACQHMWSIDKLTGGITTLFASNAMKSHVDVVEKENWPAVISASAIQTKLYKINELVLDIPSALRQLAAPYLKHCIKLAANDSYILDIDSENNIRHVTINNDGTPVQFSAQKYIFTAGSGNAQITQPLNNHPAMQVRPLHMVLVKSKNLLPLYGHCVSLSSAPRITITTHIAQDNTPVWYLGGKIAEEGVHLNAAQQIDAAKRELAELFPGLDLSAAQYATFFIDRAEAKQGDGTKPSTCTMFNTHNYITAWPTKLALAPVLAQQILDQLQFEQITPKAANVEFSLPQPLLAKPIWDELF